MTSTFIWYGVVLGLLSGLVVLTLAGNKGHRPQGQVGRRARPKVTASRGRLSSHPRGDLRLGLVDAETLEDESRHGNSTTREDRHALCDCRRRERRRHPDPLQRPRFRQADRADPRLPVNGNSWERQERVLLEGATAASATTGGGSARPASRRPATTTTRSPPTSRRCWTTSRLIGRRARRVLDGDR